MRRRLGAALVAPAGWGAGGLDTLRSDLGLGRGFAAAGFAGLAVVLGALAGINPGLAVGAVLGLAFALIAFTNLGAAFVVFAFVSFFEFALPAGAASLTKAAGLVLAMAWLARLAATRGRETTFITAHPGITYLMLAYLGWGVLSVTWSPDAGATLVSVSRYLLNFALLVIAYSAIRRRDLATAFFAAWIAGTAFTAVYGLINTPTSDATEAARLESSVGDANEFAAILVSGIVISIAVAATPGHAPLLRFAGAATAVIALFAFVLTGSRSGVVSLCVVLLVSVLVAGRRWRPIALGVAVTVSLSAIVFFAAFAPASIRERIAQTAPGQVNTATEGRTTIWQVGWRMFEDKPFHGVGLGGFQTASRNYVLQPGTLARSDQIIDTPKVAHNTYLETLSELGIVGLVLFLGIIAFPLICALLAAANFARIGDLQLEVLARALVVALAGVLAADFFVSAQLSKLLWLLLAMGPVLLAISRKALSSAPAAQAAATPTPLAAQSRS